MLKTVFQLLQPTHCGLAGCGFHVDVLSDNCPVGEETDMFRVDMSGFKAKGDVATLIGAPKGYQDSVRMPAAGIVSATRH